MIGMKIRFGRVFAMILAILLVLQPLSAHAWWIDGGGTVGGMLPNQDGSAVIKTGDCGENLTYILKESGNLFISGTGPMYDYEEGGSPWYSYASKNRTNVYFDSGVTYIGKFAFGRCYRISQVFFPDTLVEIGDDAFIYAAEMFSITLPEGLTRIGDRAFAVCGHPGSDGYYFNSVVLPSTIKSIGYQAFYMCATLSSINFPEGLEYIDSYAFGGCYALTEVILPESITHLGKAVFNSCNQLTTLRLPDTLEVLPADLVSCMDSGKSSMKTITLPKNLKVIESNALECRELKEIHIPGNVESIAAEAFSFFSGTIYFKGDAPSFDPMTFNDGVARSVTIHYPDNNATWNGVVGQNFGGNITWVPTHYHSYYKATITLPTCVSQGYTKYVCYCEMDYYIADYVDATGVHTYENGSCTVCGDTPAPVTIINQPESVEAAVGTKFAITAGAQGDGLTYQWYYKEGYQKNFSASNNRTSAYAYTMQDYMHNRSVYCVITDQYGNQVATETAIITRPPVTVRINKQPESVQAEIGQRFSVSVQAEGDGSTYQWYYKNAGSKEFAVSSNKSSAYAYSMQSYMAGRQVYCVITDQYGNSVTTDVATISLPPKELEILTQPTDVYASLNEKFSIAPKVQGDGLTYQWYYKESYQNKFSASSNRTSAYAYSMQSYMNGRSVYCVITDQFGNTVQTDVVTIKVK